MQLRGPRSRTTFSILHWGSQTKRHNYIPATSCRNQEAELVAVCIVHFYHGKPTLFTSIKDPGPTTTHQAKQELLHLHSPSALPKANQCQVYTEAHDEGHDLLRAEDYCEKKFSFSIDYLITWDYISIRK